MNPPLPIPAHESPGFAPLAARAAAGISAALPGVVLGVGMDLVEIERMRASLARFGERFVQRVFTAREAAYAWEAPGASAERLAARFAAKEAALKALRLADLGVGWKDMEVFRHPDGRCDLHLHGRAATHAEKNGVIQTSLSLSHDGGYAAAFVIAAFRSDPHPRGIP